MIDQTIRNLLEQAIDAPVKLHLLLIFHDHPRLEVTPEVMAERSCRDIWSVATALREMADDGILATKTGAEPRYVYAPLPEYSEPVRRLMRLYDDPLQRDMLQRLIRDLAEYAPYRRISPQERQFAIA